jgi:site-specific DNA-methyltransferase (adenine-specific)
MNELLNSDAILALQGIEPSSADFVFADPPYFLSNGGISVKSGKQVSVDKGLWDKSQGFEEEMEFHNSWIGESLNVLKPNGSLAISGTYHSIFKCGYLLQKHGCRIINDLVWFKPNGAPALAGRNFTASHETILWASKGPKAKHVFNYKESKEWTPKNDKLHNPGKQMRSVWSIPSTPPNEKKHGSHPTQKPLELMLRILAMCSEEEGLVVDPFCGSGTTGVAATLLNRNFLGIDLDSDYIALAAKRIESANEDYPEYQKKWNK